jgi:hypothetical protein
VAVEADTSAVEVALQGRRRRVQHGVLGRSGGQQRREHQWPAGTIASVPTRTGCTEHLEHAADTIRIADHRLEARSLAIRTATSLIGTSSHPGVLVREKVARSTRLPLDTNLV